MKIQDIMTQPVVSCSPETNLSAVAMLMWTHDCGVIPLISADQKAIGVITDRDICMAVATKHRKAEEISVAEVIGGPLQTCLPGDTIRTALNLMKTTKIRRLPVVDREGKLQGMVSINDIVLAATETKSKDMPSYEDVVKTLKAVCEHQTGGVITKAA